MSTLAQTFVSDMAEPQSAALSPKRIAAMLHVGVAELATLVGVTRATLSRLPVTAAAERALSPLAGVLAMAAEMAGSLDRAALWFKHQPLPGWGGKTPRDLFAAGRSQDVLDYLEASRAGVYA